MSNLEAINGMLLEEGKSKDERTEKLMRVANAEMQMLAETKPIKDLENLNKSVE